MISAGLSMKVLSARYPSRALAVAELKLYIKSRSEAFVQDLAVARGNAPQKSPAKNGG
jgi:hypothetical protein